MKPVTKYFLLLFFITFCLVSCTEKYSSDQFVFAKIEAYDFNCNTCILSFPDDEKVVENLLGKSKDSYYHAINLNADDYEIGQTIGIRLRKPENNENIACITLYPSEPYEPVFVLEISELAISMN